MRRQLEWSHQAALLATGINTGILLLRNDDGFSPTFWKDVALVSRINLHVQRNSSTPEGRIKVNTLDMLSATIHGSAPVPELNLAGASKE